MVEKKYVIVGVGRICLTTEDGETHNLIVGGEEIALNSLELDNLHDAIHAYLVAQ